MGKKSTRYCTPASGQHSLQSPYPVWRVWRTDTSATTTTSFYLCMHAAREATLYSLWVAELLAYRLRYALHAFTRTYTVTHDDIIMNYIVSSIIVILIITFGCLAVWDRFNIGSPLSLLPGSCTRHSGTLSTCTLLAALFDPIDPQHLAVHTT